MAADSVDALFKNLDSKVQSGEYDDVIEVCDQILKKIPGDQDARKAKCVALIGVSRYDEAVATAGSDFPLERAYCLYKLGKVEEAQRLLKSVPQDSDARTHLEAQVLYRLGDYAGAAKLYDQLSAKEAGTGGGDVELRVNAAAAHISSGQAQRVLPAEGDLKSLLVSGGSGGGGDAHAFEWSYNVACAAIDCGRLAVAADLLRQAEAQCREYMAAQDATEDEVSSEVASILVQQAVVVHMQRGHHGEEQAAEVYSNVLKSKPTDVAVTAVASNNLVALKRDRDMFDSLKRMKGAASGEAEGKLTVRQRRAVHLNRALLLMYAGKVEQCREQLAELSQQSGYADSDVPSLVNAALLHRERKLAAAEDALRAYASAHGNDKAARVLVTLAQLQIGQSNFVAAAETLSSIPSIQHQLAVVGTLVGLHRKQGDTQSAARVLDAAYQHWSSSRDEAAKKTANSVLKASADFKLKSGLFASAAQTYEALVKAMPGDKDVLAALVHAYAMAGDISKAEQYAAQLPSVDVGRLSAADLENLSASKLTSATKKRTIDEAAIVSDAGKASASDIQMKKKQRKRKPRLPKNYDPAKKPDPERWLPLRERSSYKKGKKKSRQAQPETFRGPQGAPSSGAAAVPVPTATPVSPPSTGKAPVPAIPAHIEKKKKKGGR